MLNRSASLAMSTSVLKSLPCKFSIDSIDCLCSQPGKSDKNLSEKYIKTETITKAPVKFQKSQHIMVGEFAHTRYKVLDMATNKCLKTTKFSLKQLVK